MPDIPAPVPQVVTKKHRLTIVVAIIVVVIVGTVIAGGALWLLWRSNHPASPSVSNGSLPIGIVGQPNSTDSPNPVTSVSPLPNRSTELAQKQHNLVLTINYTS